MSKHDPIADVPTPDEVRAELERIVGSDVFRSSPQLAAFLRFVVEAVLHGHSDRIKGYTIGVEVLRRDTKFDPQLDPIVRVEATRLRRALERYYGGPGLDDPVLIGLPRGSYVPTFHRRTEIVDKELDDGRLRTLWLGAARPHWLAPVLLVAALIAAGIIAAAVLWQRGAPSAITASPSPAGADRLQPGNGLPVLFVQPFTVTGTPGPDSISATSLYTRLTDAFSNFDLVNIRWQPGGASAPQRNGQQADTRSHIDYRLIDSIEYFGDGAARLRFSLVDTVDGNIIWSRVFDRVAGAKDRAAAEDAVVRQLAETLVQPFGVIYSDGRNKSIRMHLGDPRYRCILETAETFRSFDPAEHLRAQTCLEHFTSVDPNFAIGFTYLAAIDLREYLYRLDVDAGSPPPLERALIAAKRGVELNPESSRAYEMLFVVLFARHDMTAAFAAGDKSIKLNKYDMRSIGSYGARLIAMGDIDRGMALLAQADPDGRVVPTFEQFFLFLGYYMRGDMQQAAVHADQLTGTTFQLGLIARALAASAKGDKAAAGAALDRLVALNPAWHDDLRGSLSRFFPADFGRRSPGQRSLRRGTGARIHKIGRLSALTPKADIRRAAL